MDISVIIPVFDEQENILPLAEQVSAALATQAAAFEIVFVDDASRDGTWEKIQAARQRDPRVRGLRHQKNAGQSAALWTGVRNTTSPILATLDGDLQNDPADLPKLLAELKNVDFVCGMRTNRKDTWVRHASSAIARSARGLFLDGTFRDTGCFLRVFKRTSLDGVLPFNGWHRFLPLLVHGAGATVKEIPVGHRPRIAGVSKYGVWNRVWRGIYDLIGVSWYQKRRLRPTALAETK